MMDLETESAGPIALTNFDEVRDALSKLDAKRDGFVILKDDKRLIQTAFDGDGFVIEKSEGADDPLYRAFRNGTEKFAVIDVEAAFQSWYGRAPMPAGLQWSVEDEGGTSIPFKRILLTVLLVGAACIFYAIVRNR